MNLFSGHSRGTFWDWVVVVASPIAVFGTIWDWWFERPTSFTTTLLVAGITFVVFFPSFENLRERRRTSS